MANSKVMAVLTRDTQVQKSPSNYFRHLHRCRSHHLMWLTSRLLWTNKKKSRCNLFHVKWERSSDGCCYITEPSSTFPDQFRSHSRAKQMKRKLFFSTEQKSQFQTEHILFSGCRCLLSWYRTANRNAKWVRSEQNAHSNGVFSPSSMLYISFTFRIWRYRPNRINGG